ncbi:MAG: helix-turn-helix transcriptional regulator [Lactobacillales bacterium]|jgi:AraC-like DNA-binding protein|nr:helix-turn-helix transcriptional regulator [Lactobacillales bacterium]
MKKNLSLEFTDPQEYIRNLDYEHFGYSVTSNQKVAMHFSRIHLLDDIVITFSDSEPSIGSFFNEECATRYIGLRFLKSGRERHCFHSRHLDITGDECLFFDLTGKGVYERLTRTEGINVLLPFPVVSKKINDNHSFCVPLDCAKGLGRIVKDYTFSFESQLPFLTEEERDRAIENYLDLLCQWLLECQERSSENRKELLFLHIEDYISRHLCDETLSLTNISDFFSVSSRTIQKIFNEQGMTFSKYVIEKRLLNSLKDLLSNHLSITDVAYKWSFCDTSYFCRKFKEKFGMTPTAYYEHFQSYTCTNNRQQILCPIKERRKL